ncbi:hypothetical protein FRX31_019264 [Thalictrum thalictroides]|uniref:Uncharacterized protein n=1 Tax=Thalictrum thalictroides TaxID=46969 RepID=A0A7J6W1U3_THATH|nr:hypothetical protein FRX31_019264 [Thalictrum thalictroides]
MRLCFGESSKNVEIVDLSTSDSDSDVVILSKPPGYTQENPIPVLSTSVDNLTNQSNPSITAFSSSEEPMEYGSSEEPSLKYGIWIIFFSADFLFYFSSPKSQQER